MTVDDAVTQLAASLSAAGIDTPRLDARRLLEAATGLSMEALVLEPSRPLAAAAAATLSAFAARRIAREPVSRILRRRDFYGRTFEVTPGILDPRPDTETLVDLVLSLVRIEGGAGRPLRILDVGTGSGAILLTLLSELPSATGLGTDVSAAALTVATRNAAALGLSDRVEWRLACGLEGIAGPFDVLVSNPPYIPSGEIPSLEPEVRDYDPIIALDGGADGLDIVRRLIEGAPDCISDTGWCVLELGAGQAEAVRLEVEKRFDISGSGSFRTATDLGGHVRCVAWKPQIEIGRK